MELWNNIKVMETGGTKCRRHEDGSFEVFGRFDHSDVRGCNLLVS